MGHAKNLNSVALLSATGKLMGGPETAHLGKQLHNLEANGYNYIALDLSKVQWLNSAAIGILIEHYLRLQERGGGLSLIRPSEKVNHYLTITKLSEVFPTFDSYEHAVS